MAERTSVERHILAALEQDPAINLHRHPIHIEYDITNRALTLEGEVGTIIAKRRAFARASAIDGVDGIMDRLRVTPAARRGDGAIYASLADALLGEPAFATYTIHVRRKGARETLREATSGGDHIEVFVADGVVELTGRVGSLSHKRLADVLAWWAPGSCDVINELQIVPPESDNDGEIADALHLALEKDPLVHADRIGVRVRNRRVTLTGFVATDEERRMAEFDAWYLTGVEDVVNEITVRR